MHTGGHKHVTSPACAVMHGNNEVWSIKCIIKAESVLLKHCLLHYHFIISAPDTAKKTAYDILCIGLHRVQQHKSHKYYISQELLAEYPVLVTFHHHIQVIKPSVE
jgi:hypothetical protein